jgi:hypothetical protein
MKYRFVLILILLSFVFFETCKQTPKTSNKEGDTSVESTLLSDVLSDSITNTNVDSNIFINIQLNSSSIKVLNDSLYFSYKVTNKTSKDLLLYHIQYLDIKLESYTESDFPKCSIHIIDSNNKLPQNMLSILGTPKTIVPSEYDTNSFALLATGESRIFNRTVYIGNIQLEKGDYKLKLKYLSPYNEYYAKRFKTLQKRNIKLKDYDLFEGIVESNICPFTIIKPIQLPPL